MVVPLMDAMNRDPKLWPQAHVFRPERFLSADAVTGEAACKRPEHLMPFQCGRRACIGEHMGRALVFLFTVTLLQRFRLAFPAGFSYDVDAMPPECGFTLVPRPFPVALSRKGRASPPLCAARSPQ